MEGGPRINSREALPETPDLLAAYADQEGAVFGISGTIGDLAGMCPINLNDPRITLEAKNEFVAKVMNESGMEIAAEHEAYVSSIVEKQGLERKFTVTVNKPEKAEHEQPKVVPDKVPAKPKPHGSHTKQAETTDKDDVERLHHPEESIAGPLEVDKRKETAAKNLGELATPAELSAGPDSRKERTEPEAEAVASKPTSERVNAAVFTETTAEEVERAARAHLSQVYGAMEATQAQPQDVATGEDNPSARLPVPQTSVEQYSDTGNSEYAAEAPGAERTIDAEGTLHSDMLETAPADDHVGDVGELATILPIATITARSFEDVALSPEIPEAITWHDELAKKPEELYEDFVEALHDATAPASVESPVVPANETAEDTAGDEPQVEPILAITVDVTEHLDRLATEEKEAVGLLIHDIVQLAQAGYSPETKGAEPQDIEIVRAELEKLVVALFERLKVTYEPEDITHFITLLTRPDFQPPQPEELQLHEADLEHDGTREAKRSFSQAAGTIIADTEYACQRSIGALALFRNRQQLIYRQAA